MQGRDELKVSVKVQRGRDVRKFSIKHYIPPSKPFSQLFEDLKAEVIAILNEIIRR